MTTKKKNACGHADCGVSSGISDELTFGRGELDDNGYWEIPCRACAENFEREHPGTAKQYGIWPKIAVNKYTCCRKNHTTACSFEEAQGALNYAEEDPVVAYVRRESDGLVIARRTLTMNPIFETERTGASLRGGG